MRNVRNGLEPQTLSIPLSLPFNETACRLARHSSGKHEDKTETLSFLSAWHFSYELHYKTRLKGVAGMHIFHSPEMNRQKKKNEENQGGGGGGTDIHL